MKSVTNLLLCLLLFIPALAMGSDFNYTHYEALLKRHVKSAARIDGITVNAVDYASLASDAKRADSDYGLLLKELAAFDPATLKSREEKIAFWVNVYNMAAMKTIVDHYPVESIRSKKINWLGLPWNRKAINVGGKEYALGEIENDILLDTFKDLRIHFGINCASVSCADLRPEQYRSAILFKQLEEQGRRLLADPKKGMRIDREKKTVYISQIFKFDKKHFDALGGGAINFILLYLKPAEKEMIRSGALKVDYLDYDWKANDSKNAQ
ncbi:MAG: hypothetical protein FD174_2727 [Geobacteraceae bacterium]|nr:MAG: hypothetical protein FD174_2727 [Geobacteraceae bacterium]